LVHGRGPLIQKPIVIVYDYKALLEMVRYPQQPITIGKYGGLTSGPWNCGLADTRKKTWKEELQKLLGCAEKRDSIL
jgi:hypothetical protein